MRKWIQTILRPVIGNIMRKFPRVYELYQKAFFYCVEKNKLRGMHRVGYEYADELGKILDKSGINYFYTYGTMLGLVREGGFIAHDSDIDMGVILDDNFSWEKLETCLKSIGFHKKHFFTYNDRITEQTYIKNGLSVDFFAYMLTENNSMLTYCYVKEEGKEYEKDQWSIRYYKHSMFEGMKKIECHDVSFRIPLNPEKYLEEVYGPSWKTPNSGWISEKKTIEGAFGYIVRNYD